MALSGPVETVNLRNNHFKYSFSAHFINFCTHPDIAFNFFLTINVWWLVKNDSLCYMQIHFSYFNYKSVCCCLFFSLSLIFVQKTNNQNIVFVMDRSKLILTLDIYGEMYLSEIIIGVPMREHRKMTISVVSYAMSLQESETLLNVSSITTTGSITEQQCNQILAQSG